LERRAGLLASALVATSAALWTWLAFWKYDRFLYDALDLAIYAQVTWNTSFGRLFQFSIHPQSYLGDHFEPFLLAVAPLYALWRDPRFLLLVQVAVLHLAALPLYALARNCFTGRQLVKSPRLLATAVVFTYLANPFVHNALAFEFHVLNLLVPLVLAGFYFAERGRVGPGLACFLGALLVREDAAFVVALSGAVAVALFPAARRQWRTWTLGTCVAAAVWFVVAVVTVSVFAPHGQYKFTLYYGGGDGTNLWSLVAEPWVIFARIGRVRSLTTALGLLLPVAFLPLLAVPALALGALPFLQFTTAVVDIDGVFYAHYGIPFLPALFVGTVAGLQRLAGNGLPALTRRLRLAPPATLHLATMSVLAAAVYGAATYGPVGAFWRHDSDGAARTAVRATYRTAAAFVAADDNVVAAKRFLPALAQRPRLAPLHYVLRGRQQLSDLPYEVPWPVDVLVVSHDDVLLNGPVRGRTRVYQDTFAERALRLRAVLDRNGLAPAWARDDVAVFLPGATAQRLVTVEATAADDERGVVLAPGVHASATLDRAPADVATLMVRWQVSRTLPEPYFLELTVEDERGAPLKALELEPGWGLVPSDSWRAGTTIVSSFPLTWPGEAKRVRLRLRPTAHLTYFLDSRRSVVPVKTAGASGPSLVVNGITAPNQ
jgi:uncharacterized membrane protein